MCIPGGVLGQKEDFQEIGTECGGYLIIMHPGHHRREGVSKRGSGTWGVWDAGTDILK